MSRSVDQDFALITQEFQILPNTTDPQQPGDGVQLPDVQRPLRPAHDARWSCKLGHRVRLRLVNFSTADHHPIHLHGHTWWVTGTEGGRIPESGWIPGNNVLVGVAQARDVEFIANNPGDWIMHCHMFHHTMNHMVSMAGPMTRVAPDDPRGLVPGFPQNMEAGMGDGDPRGRPPPARPARGAGHAPRLVAHQGADDGRPGAPAGPVRQGHVRQRAVAPRLEHLRADPPATEDDLIGPVGRSGKGP